MHRICSSLFTNAVHSFNVQCTSVTAARNPPQGVLDYVCLRVCLGVAYCLFMLYICAFLYRLRVHKGNKSGGILLSLYIIHWICFLYYIYVTFIQTNTFRTFKKFLFNLLHYSPLPPTTPTLPGGTTAQKRKAPPPPKSPRQVSPLVHNVMVALFKARLLPMKHFVCFGMVGHPVLTGPAWRPYPVSSLRRF